jgi:hypothetical protein
MQRLGRLPWPHALAFRCHGAVIGVRATSGRAIELVRPHLPPDSVEVDAAGAADALYSWVFAGEDTGRRVHLVYEDAEVLAQTLDEGAAVDAIARGMDFQVALHSPEQLFVHAGVVGWCGRAIVVPGRTFSGKSTLVEALVRAGAEYYSDEFAVIDANGLVHPYARPLALRDAAGRPRGRFPVRALRGVAGTEPVRLGLVLDTEYVAGTSWEPHTIGAGEALLKLLDNAVVARLRPEFTMDRLAVVVPGAVALRGARGDADATAALVLQRATALFGSPDGSAAATGA